MISESQKAHAMRLIREGKLNAVQIAEIVGVAQTTVRAWRASGRTTSRRHPPLATGLRVAGFEVLEMVADHYLCTQRRYRVRFDCCGDEREYSEKALKWRITHAAQYCAECARIVGGKTLVSTRHQPAPERGRGLPLARRNQALHLALSGAWR